MSINSIFKRRVGRTHPREDVRYDMPLNEKNLKIPENGAIRAVEAVLSTKQQRAVNVSFQSILEALTLNLCSWYQA